MSAVPQLSPRELLVKPPFDVESDEEWTVEIESELKVPRVSAWLLLPPTLLVSLEKEPLVCDTPE